jgi:outer membrane protein assembly factor BamB/6-phosphogluconolactonase (cycloisomerase 2 family)
MLKVRWFFVLLVISSFLFLSQMTLAEECPDQNTQRILQKLSEISLEGKQVGPVATDGLKGGGDLIWWFQGIENVVCVSKFVDVDGDALPDVLMESYDAGAPVADHFFCIKGNSPGYGTVLWSCHPPGGASNSGGYGDQCVSYIEDVNGDGHADALLGTAWGGRTAYAIDGMTGGVIWSYDTYAHGDTGWVYSICPITDLTGDGKEDVLFCVGSPGNAAFCVNGVTGNRIWKFHANDAVMSICQIEDANGDGYSDAVIAGGDDEHRLICLSGHSTGSPSIIWQFTSTAGFEDVSVIDDVNGDGHQDVIAGGWAYYVYCRNGFNGAQIWNYYVGSGDVVMRVEPIADINGDGIQDVLVGTWKNAIICLSGANGSLICSYTVGTTNGGDVWSVDPIADVNGDGYPEALGGSFDTYVYCVDVKACSLLWKYYTGNRLYTVRGLPDVNGDGTPEALAGTQMSTERGGGKAYCISGGEPQNIVPHVMSTSPPQNELNVPINTNITVRFDVDMMPSSINESTFVVNAWSTGLHKGTITYDSPTKTATLNPTRDFDEGEIVTVVITTGIKSSVGTPMESSYVWSFTTKVEDGACCFTPPFNYGAGHNPSSVFCADLDGDTYPDLAVANEYSDSVSILKNNGDGTFQSAVNYGAGDGPYSVFCADLDGDDDLDLAVANSGSNNVSILKNKGDGSFEDAVNYGTGDAPHSVFCADLDGDGDLDLAVANYGSDSVSILENNKDGTFQNAVNYGVGGAPYSIFCADLDRDGDLDLAVTDYGSDSVSILKNNGDGTFQAKVDYETGDYPVSVFCADLNGDSHLDLAVTRASISQDNVSILKNNGDGTFQTKVEYSAGDISVSVFCADLDKDSDLDLAVANYSDENVSILKNNGDGSFQPQVFYPIGGISPYSVFSADLDRDGDLDLAVANHWSDNVSILLNIRRGDCNGDRVIDISDVVFLINFLFINGPAPVPLPVGDVNCDGVVDVSDVVYLINYLFINGPAPCC